MEGSKARTLPLLMVEATFVKRIRDVLLALAAVNVQLLLKCLARPGSVDQVDSLISSAKLHCRRGKFPGCGVHKERRRVTSNVRPAWGPGGSRRPCHTRRYSGRHFWRQTLTSKTRRSTRDNGPLFWCAVSAKINKHMRVTDAFLESRA